MNAYVSAYRSLILVCWQLFWLGNSQIFCSHILLNVLSLRWIDSRGECAVMCFHLLQAPCCGKLYVCRLCHDAEENHEMDRFKVKEVQCSECQTVQQVSEDGWPSLPAGAGQTTPIMPQLLVMYLCLYWCLLLFKGTADLWAVPCTVWRILLWYLPLVWQEQKAVSLSSLWNMQVSSFSYKNIFDYFLLRLGREGFHYQLFSCERNVDRHVFNVKWGWFWNIRLTDIQRRARDVF